MRPIAASTCESSRRGARCLPTACPTATSAAAATTPAAMSRPLRCSSTARWAPSTSVPVVSTSPRSTRRDSSEITLGASAGSCRRSHRIVPISAASANDPPPKSGPATASASVDGSSTRSNGSRTMPTTSASPSWTRSKDSIDTRPSTGLRVPISNPYSSAARSLTMISSVLPGAGYRPAMSSGRPRPPGDDASPPTSMKPPSPISIGAGAAATVVVRWTPAMRGSATNASTESAGPSKNTTTSPSSVAVTKRSIESPARRAPAASARAAPTGTATSSASRTDDVHRRRRSARAHSHAALARPIPAALTPTAMPRRRTGGRPASAATARSLSPRRAPRPRHPARPRPGTRERRRRRGRWR